MDEEQQVPFLVQRPEAVFVGPSLLACDFSNLAQEAQRATDAGADYLHLDVMDGHFVPNLSMGPAIVAAVNRSVDTFLDVHLMIYNPFDYIEAFAAAGADRITIHLEATENVADTLNFIRTCNVQAGLAFCPETSESLVLKYLDKCDLVLLMTVNPGFGGQSFMPQVLDKVRFVRHMCTQLGVKGPQNSNGDYEPFPIQVDGGINYITAQQCVDAGANHLVAGTWLFKDSGLQKGIAALHSLAHPSSQPEI